MKVLPSICQQIWKSQQWPQDWKRSVFIPIPKKGNAKECSNYHTTALISHASKVMFKILQARLQQYVNRDLSDVQAGFIFIYLFIFCSRYHLFYFFLIFFKFYFVFKLYIIVLVLPNIKMNLPQVYMCSSWF